MIRCENFRRNVIWRLKSEAHVKYRKQRCWLPRMPAVITTAQNIAHAVRDGTSLQFESLTKPDRYGLIENKFQLKSPKSRMEILPAQKWFTAWNWSIFKIHHCLVIDTNVLKETSHDASKFRPNDISQFRAFCKNTREKKRAKWRRQ